MPMIYSYSQTYDKKERSRYWKNEVLKIYIEGIIKNISVIQKQKQVVEQTL